MARWAHPRRGELVQRHIRGLRPELDWLLRVFWNTTGRKGGKVNQGQPKPGIYTGDFSFAVANSTGSESATDWAKYGATAPTCFQLACLSNLTSATLFEQILLWFLAGGLAEEHGWAGHALGPRHQHGGRGRRIQLKGDAGEGAGDALRGTVMGKLSGGGRRAGVFQLHSTTSSQQGARFPAPSHPRSPSWSVARCHITTSAGKGGLGARGGTRDIAV